MVTTEHYANHTSEVTDADGEEDEYGDDGISKWRTKAKNDYD